MKKNKDKKIYCSIILAAGMSSRMGKFKPLLDIGGKTAIKRIIESNKDAGVENIVVVTGHNYKRIEDALIGCGVTFAYNADYEQGMFTSIQTGLREGESQGDFQAFFLFPVDVPLVSSKVITLLMDAMENHEDSFVVPCYQGKKGHPLLIPHIYREEILKHDGTNGLKGITNKYDHKLLRVDTEEESVVLDMDKPEDYEAILTYYDAPKSSAVMGNILEETGFEGRLYLVRHGSTQLHKEKIFMGQVDIPLSDEGRNQVKISAQTLAEAAPNTDIIYTSPLLRAKESGEIIRDRFLLEGIEKKLFEVPQFMEMNLGDWDGRYISEIKEKYPQEYEKRGQNLLTYKRDPDGENNYDLKYRVLKELKRIMNETDVGEDLILVVHKGVINVIRENIFALDSAEAIKYNPPKGSITLIEKSFMD